MVQISGIKFYETTLTAKQPKPMATTHSTFVTQQSLLPSVQFSGLFSGWFTSTEAEKKTKAFLDECLQHIKAGKFKYLGRGDSQIKFVDMYGNEPVGTHAEIFKERNKNATHEFEINGRPFSLEGIRTPGPNLSTTAHTLFFQSLDGQIKIKLRENFMRYFERMHYINEESGINVVYTLIPHRMKKLIKALRKNLP